MAIGVVLVSLLLNLNISYICCSVSIATFEQVNARCKGVWIEANGIKWFQNTSLK